MSHKLEPAEQGKTSDSQGSAVLYPFRQITFSSPLIVNKLALMEVPYVHSKLKADNGKVQILDIAL
jgi:hypothetical protein